jgi:flagellar biosynthesis/type III secretory pathway chaperone
MNNDLIAAGSLLADILIEENAALVALDLPRAVAMLPDKQRIATDFITAQAAPIPAAQREVAERLGERLRTLAQDNRALLERAIAVQGRVIGVIVRAAAPAVAPSGYGAHGKPSHAGRPVAFALSARA